jgi:hypothetical protein
MLLHHRTPDGPKIMREGFTVCHTPNDDDVPVAWLADQLRHTRSGHQGEWLVTVDVPDEVAHAHRYPGPSAPVPGLYWLPFDVINAYQPFKLERWSDDFEVRPPAGARW